MELLPVLGEQVLVFVHLAPVQPHDGVQVFQLPLAPLVEGAVYHGVVVPGVDEQHLVPQFFLLPLVKKPQGAGQALGIEEVVAHRDQHIHVAGAHHLFPNVPVLVLAVGGGGGHHKPGPAVLV